MLTLEYRLVALRENAHAHAHKHITDAVFAFLGGLLVLLIYRALQQHSFFIAKWFDICNDAKGLLRLIGAFQLIATRSMC